MSEILRGIRWKLTAPGSALMPEEITLSEVEVFFFFGVAFRIGQVALRLPVTRLVRGGFTHL